MDNPIKLIIEALLFASDRPLTARDMHTWLPDATLSDIKKAAEELLAEYNTMERSFVLKEVAKGYQFRTRSEYASFVLLMLKASPTRLSRAALETLSIVAYKQPVLRQEIERLRGVDVGGILKTLLEKDLIKIMGRKNLPGRPLIYGTTKKFLEVFDLKDLESLPKLKEIRDLGSYEEQATPVSEEPPQEESSGQEEAGVQENGTAQDITQPSAEPASAADLDSTPEA
ncbi:MAG: SMC-Scp complex subunit ScpB [Deltaproteobacteria bacterium]|nr:SMC-Scp complex subunit ScpB [Deltaproteobacteria bacterium]